MLLYYFKLSFVIVEIHRMNFSDAILLLVCVYSYLFPLACIVYNTRGTFYIILYHPTYFITLIL